MSEFNWEVFNWAWEVAAGFESRVAMCTKTYNDVVFLAPILAKNIYTNKKYYVCPMTIQGYKEAICYLYMKNKENISLRQIEEEFENSRELEGSKVC